VIVRVTLVSSTLEKVCDESFKPFREVIPPPAPASLPHCKLPLASVSRTLEPLQLVKVAIFNPCDDIRRPVNVDVADVLTLDVSTPPTNDDVPAPETVRVVPTLRAPVEVAFVVVELPKVVSPRVVEPVEYTLAKLP
jgi:CO dehydrogenase/acetyl-CoA synthase delta subunit